ncbi:hypothetical protein SPRG_09197 [Saprolegnia parasitica CBS 223.65]|uniref:Major facilitator superfamily (MFS) profile domain-containing protein n=1 Tax=Saprolegnia parasitica (strain CBS 223.65) TaxID=695850 RepID=A0A067C2Q5_SAPPC|nr:hypothetical protein SPRG_09197 [Saprolegnia parasitica CBS 223.65]KDO25059.1 hypothetical protein SPRG_09197 [Saprolegnia parasitica CBS 223.65]|eukprot:XP_012204134.1 hypothetical protein SPRG_09197 [Saprolegnia parasitica CBS 223.65]
MDWFLRYWTITVPSKTPFEVAGELWLFTFPSPCGNGELMTWRGLRFHRWHFVCGMMYAYVNLAGTLELLFFKTVTAEHLPTTYAELIACGFVGVVGATVGPALERRQPRVGMMIGSAFFMVGLVMSHIAVLVESYWFFTLGFGSCVGTGTIIVMLSSFSTAQKWYPDYRGIAIGVTCSGFGVGFSGWAIFFLTYLGADNSVNTAPLYTVFLMVMAICGPILALSTVVMRSPPPMYIVNGLDVHCIAVDTNLPGAGFVQEEYLDCGMTLVNYDAMRAGSPGTQSYYYKQVKALSLLQCLMSTDFLLLYIAFAASIAPNVSFSQRLVPVTVTIFTHDDNEATYRVAQNTMIASVVGRLIAPSMSDFIIRVFYTNPAFARKIAFMFFVGAECITILRLQQAVEAHNFAQYEWCTTILAFTCGCGYATIPCFLIDLYGVYNMGTMYGLIITSCSIGTIVLGFGTENTSLVDPVVLVEHLAFLGYWLIAVWFIMWLVRTSSDDRFFPGYQITLFDKVLVQIPFESLNDSMTVILPEHDLSSPLHQRAASFYQFESHDEVRDSTDEFGEPKLVSLFDPRSMDQTPSRPVTI